MFVTEKMGIVYLVKIYLLNAKTNYEMLICILL